MSLLDQLDVSGRNGSNFFDIKILRILLVFVFVSAFIQGVFDLIAGLTLVHYLASFGSCFIFLALFLLSYTRFPEKFIKLIVIISFFYLTVHIFIFADGFLGNFPIFFLTIVFGISILLRGKLRVYTLAGMVCIFLSLVYIHFFKEGLIQHYESVENEIIDTIFAVITNTFVVAFGVITVLRAYRIQDKKSKDSLKELEIRHRELKEAYSEIKTLRGIIPICARCKKIRNSDGFYETVESYVSQHTMAEFSHGLCDECKEIYLSEIKKKP